MAEYIEREKLIEHLKKDPLFDLVERYGITGVIEAAPAADVRPVVVCANCEHNNHCLTQEFVYDCGKIPLGRNTFFCADGERRSNA